MKVPGFGGRSRLDRWWAWGSVVLAVAVVLAGCSGDRPVTRTSDAGTPTGASVAPAPPEATGTALATQKAAARIANCPTTTPTTPVEGGLPGVTLGCLGGGPAVDLAGLRGTPTVINVWAQWCPPCRQEAPYLAQVSTAAKGKVNFLGVDYVDPRPELAIEFARQAGWHYPQIVDGDGALRVPLKIPGGPPITVFVAADGRIAGTHIGPFTSAGQLRAQINSYLGVRL